MGINPVSHLSVIRKLIWNKFFVKISFLILDFLKSVLLFNDYREIQIDVMYVESFFRVSKYLTSFVLQSLAQTVLS